ncbi:sialate O-acetylesterase [Verrucomicrobiota bacterium]
MKSFIISAIALFMFSVAALAEVNLPVVIGDNMVLQRDTKVPIWGWANAGEKVTVEFAGQKKTTITDESNKWLVRLDPMKASAEPRILKISNISLTNILVGEVWICSGQSNMEWPLRALTGVNQKTAKEELGNPNIRLFRVSEHVQSEMPMDDTAGEWTTCEKDHHLMYFSGVGFLFGSKLHNELGVPVGLIDTSWGGTPIEPWIAAEGYKMIGKPLPELDENKKKMILNNFRKTVNDVEKWHVKARKAADAGRIMPFSVNMKSGGRSKNYIYNAMVAPLTPYAVKGAIWYQGESNRGSKFPHYFNMLKALIGGWREVFEAPDLPLYIVQIAPFDYNKGRQGPDINRTLLCDNIWAAEYKAAAEIRNCGVVPTHDTINGNIKDIHPRNKKPVAERLAAMALNKTYGKNVICSGPVFKNAKLSDGKVVVRFDKVDQGLETEDGKAPSWFELAGEDKEFVNAEAVLKENTVVVTSENIANPKFVRMGWNETAIPNLRDKNGWPVFQFPAKEIN